MCIKKFFKKNLRKHMNRHFSQEIIQMAKTCMNINAH